MELWIRSQNKGNLMKAEILGQTDGVVTCYFTNGTCELGRYETSERALEVLDEIQDLLQNSYVGNANRIVYQMPAE